VDADQLSDDDDLERQIVRMASVESHLEALVIRASHHLGGGVHCSMILRHQGENRRVASSSRRSASCDDAENRVGSGPCLTAMDDLHTILVPDVHLDDTWPEWSRQVLASGFRSGAAFPVAIDAEADIAFNLYSEAPNPWDASTVLHADTYAQQAGDVMALCLDVARLTAAKAATDAGSAAVDRINQAIGVLMAQQHVDAGAALTMLTGRATDQGVDVLDVAAAILADLGTGATPQSG
jgi:ANTAR domain